eukprot:363572-Chlamydomonas_euryale.AAC.8
MHAWARHVHVGAHDSHLESAVQQIRQQGVVAKWSRALVPVLASNVDSSRAHPFQIAGEAGSVEGNVILTENPAHSPSGCILAVSQQVARNCAMASMAGDRYADCRGRLRGTLSLYRRVLDRKATNQSN